MPSSAVRALLFLVDSDTLCHLIALGDSDILWQLADFWYFCIIKNFFAPFVSRRFDISLISAFYILDASKPLGFGTLLFSLVISIKFACFSLIYTIMRPFSGRWKTWCFG